MISCLRSRWILIGLFIWCVSAVLQPVTASPTRDDTTHVRVRLGHGSLGGSVKLTVDDGPLAVHIPNDDAPVMRLQPGERTTVGVRQSDVYLRRGPDGLYATKLHLRPVRADATWSLSRGNEESTYTGGLMLSPNSESSSNLLLVNRVPIEDYVASVVASEYGLDDRAGKKAMAVVARTYGLFASEKFGGAYDHADGTASQVYDGLDAVTDASRNAARATSGEVLSYDGTLIQAVYCSSSGGHTANNEDVWNAKKPIPYLRGKEDPYDSASPHHTWSTSVDRSALLQALTRKRGKLVNGFVIDAQTSEGRIKSIALLHADDTKYEMNANTFRLVVNRGVEGSPLKSTWFEASRNGDDYSFSGHGFGHGVGLSQWGAHAMAQEGKTYREILQFYYTGVEIQQLDNVDKDPEGVPVVQNPQPEGTDSDSTRRIGW